MLHHLSSTECNAVKTLWLRQYFRGDAKIDTLRLLDLVHISEKSVQHHPSLEGEKEDETI
jgi:hypothetical protein